VNSVEVVSDREKVIESYYRCLITDDLQRKFALPADAMPGCVNHRSEQFRAHE
jgi:hypothetical protein